MPHFLYPILFFTLLNVHSTALAQTLQFNVDFKKDVSVWTKLRDIQPDAQGNLFVAATSVDSGVEVFTFSKLNKNGENIWSRRFADPGRHAELQAFRQDVSGNLFLLGNTKTEKKNSAELLLIKCDSLGHMLWNKKIKPEHFRIYTTDLAIDLQGNSYIYGWQMNAKGDYDYYLARIDATGLFKWSFVYDGGRNDYAKNVAIDASGNVVITGTRTTSTNKYDICTIKLDRNGKKLWGQVFDGPTKGSEEPVSLELDKKGNIYLAGTTDAASGTKNFLALKYSKRGKLAWSRIYDGKAGKADFVNSACLDHKGNFYLGGYSETPDFHYAATLLKWSKKGKQLWALEHTGNSGSYSCNEICTDLHGNILLAGTWLQNPTDSRYFAAIFDSKGHMTWSNSQPALGTMQFGMQGALISTSEFYIGVERREANSLWNFSVLKFAKPASSAPEKMNTLTN